MVEQESHGVREDFAKQSACQMPEVLGPHPLYGVALCELAKDCVYPVTKPTEQGALLGSRVSLLGRVGSHKFHTDARQHLPNLRRVVVAVCDDQPRAKFGDLWEHGKLMSVGWSHRKASYDSRPRDPDVHPEAVEGLPKQHVLAESRLSFEAFASVGAGKQARRQGQRVADGERRVVWSECEEFLPERLSLTFQRLAACLAKVVRWTSPRVGNHSL